MSYTNEQLGDLINKIKDKLKTIQNVIDDRTKKYNDLLFELNCLLDLRTKNMGEDMVKNTFAAYNLSEKDGSSSIPPNTLDSASVSLEVEKSSPIMLNHPHPPEVSGNHDPIG